MDGDPQRDLKVSSERHDPGPHNANPGFSDAACRDHRSIHKLGSVAQDCPIKGCYMCADLVRIKDEISSTYQRLSDLMNEQHQIIAKPHHENVISRMPVEILSMIFVFVKEGISECIFKENLDYVIPGLICGQPRHSPPLLVGTVCKMWRNIALSTPQLWTDIIISTWKCPGGQLDMVQNWARRSASLPLDISICSTGEEIPDGFEDVLIALRSLADRWNDIAPHMPAPFLSKLLDNLQDSPPINTMTLSYIYPRGLEPIQLRHPLRPRQLKGIHFHNVKKIPMDWSRLVCLEVQWGRPIDVLNVIGAARSLRRCVLAHRLRPTGGNIPLSTSPITNRSLIYLRTFDDIAGGVIDHLTLPALQHLDYDITALEHQDQCFESVVGFLNRSRPPLDIFIIRCQVSSQAPFPSFRELPGITSLFVANSGGTAKIDDFLLALSLPSADVILPHLKELSLKDFDMSTSAWSLFGRLFSSNGLSSTADLESDSNTPASLRRPLSTVNIVVPNKKKVKMNKDTFLHLLSVKKAPAGVRLSLRNFGGPDLFASLASLHGVVL